MDLRGMTSLLGRLRANLRRAYAHALGPGGVDVTSPQIALVGGYVVVYGLSLLSVVGGLVENAALIVLAVAMGLLGLIAGMAVAWRPAHQPAREDPAGWDRTVIFAACLVVLGTVAMGLYLAAIGRIPMLMSEAEQGRVVAAERGGGMLRVLALLALPGCWLLVAQAARVRRPALTAWTVVSLLVTLLGQIATANRAPAFQLIAVSMGIVLLGSKRDRLRPRAVAGLSGMAAALLLAVGMLGAVRLASALPAATTPSYVRLTQEAISSYVRVPVQNLGYTLKAVPQRIGWRFGYTYLQPLLTALPGKQTTFDGDLKVALGQVYPGGGTVPGLLGEAYANFGPPGWFLVPLLLAAWLAWLSRKAISAGTPEFRALWAFAIVHAVGAFVGGLLVASPFPAIAYVVLGAAAFLSLRGDRSSSTGQSGIEQREASALG